MLHHLPGMKFLVIVVMGASRFGKWYLVDPGGGLGEINYFVVFQLNVIL